MLDCLRCYTPLMLHNYNVTMIQIKFNISSYAHSLIHAHTSYSLVNSHLCLWCPPLPSKWPTLVWPVGTASTSWTPSAPARRGRFVGSPGQLTPEAYASQTAASPISLDNGTGKGKKDEVIIYITTDRACSASTFQGEEMYSSQTFSS